MQKTLFILLIGLLFGLPATAQTEPDAAAAEPATPKKMAYSGFVGGMMIHTGYLYSRDGVYTVASSGEQLHQKVNGAPVGVGGAVKFRFGKHLRVGAEGYVSNLTYGKYKSHAIIGWGGALIEACWDVKKCRLFIGGVAGGGGERNITLFEETPVDFVTETKISHRKYGFCALVPYLGCEVPLTSRISFTAQTDWMFNVSNPQKDYATGPRIFIGIMFGHSR